MRRLLRGEALIKGRRLFQCGYPKVRRLFEAPALIRANTIFKNELLTSLKHNTKSHSHEPSNNTGRIISLLQDQIEFLQGQLKSKDKIMNSLIENLTRIDDVFFFAKGSNTKNS